MADENKAFALQGIVRNATKIGVQDGQSEDLVNLRYKDGAWRAAGAGELEFTLPSGSPKYEEIFIHTNVYRHVLGVVYNSTTDRNGTLYWFANIDADGVFSSITPVSLAKVIGAVSITQTGHLITVVDEEDDFEYFVYNTGNEEYVEVSIDANGESKDFSLFPFGFVHFNYEMPELTDPENNECIVIKEEDVGVQFSSDRTTFEVDEESAVSQTKTAIEEATKKNLFTKPFLAIAAVRLYDGSFMYCSNPTLIWAGQPINCRDWYVNENGEKVSVAETKDEKLSYGVYRSSDTNETLCMPIYKSEKPNSTLVCYNIDDKTIKSRIAVPSFAAGCNVPEGSGVVKWRSVVFGAKLSINVNDVKFLASNSNVFSSLCIFVTRETEYIDWEDRFQAQSGLLHRNGRPIFYSRRPYADVIHDLMNGSFYLLKEYTANNINGLVNNPIIDLSTPDDEGLLRAINSGAESEIITSESLNRLSYIPKYVYSYNGRLHFADYISSQFHGYPLEQFHLNNHSVKSSLGGYFKRADFGDVLKNIVSNNDSLYQYERGTITRFKDSNMVSEGMPSLIIKVEIETDNGTQVVTRYVRANDSSFSEKIEQLDPLLTYPDYRAKRIYVYYVKSYDSETGEYIGTKMPFDLKPMPYLNMAYYFSTNMKPISWESSITNGTEGNSGTSGGGDPTSPPSVDSGGQIE